MRYIIEREDDRLARRRIKCPYVPLTITDWVDAVQNELNELREAIEADHGVEDELGDVLVNLRMVARLRGIRPDVAERASLRKVHARYDYIDARLGGEFSHLGRREEWRALWEQAKRDETL